MSDRAAPLQRDTCATTNPRRHLVLVAQCVSKRTHVTPNNIMYDLDTEILINSVKIRPALYCTVLYCGRRHREMLWHEVAEQLHGDWSHMSHLHKIHFVREVQKRWKSLRTCFARELCTQRREQLKRDANINVKRRKRYEYFEKLNFLIGQYDSIEINNSDTEDSHDPSENGAGDISLDEESETRQEKKVDVNNYQRERLLERSVGVEERVLDILKYVRDYEDDDDRHFVLSLIPYFKEMNIQKKVQARIEVLKVLQDKINVKIKEAG